MFKRILHSLTLLAAIVIAYETYLFVMVPWIEPPKIQTRPSGPVEIGDGNLAVSQYQRVLAGYFPPGHWSLVRPPKVIENESATAMFVLDDYKLHDDGRVDLSHFALLIFPTSRQQTLTPRDAIILEAPHGARLQFDRKFQPERGEIGTIQRGEFPGLVTIRSDMREPGPADDLLIETSDLEMNSKLLYTESEVRFRLGPNVGGGRVMEIRLLEEETSKARAGMKISTIDSLEIFHDVRLRMHFNSASLLPGDPASAPPRPKAAPHALPLGDASTPPVELTCDGAFHFDFVRYVADFERNVQVWQANPQGAADQLSCNRLDICFARKVGSVVAPDYSDQEPASRQKDDVRWLEPDRIIAEGNPVVINSPSRDAEVRGTRVQLMLRQRRVAVEGGQDVSIRYGQNVVRAPQIHYQHPAGDAGTKIGTFRATGPGNLSYVPDLSKPQQVFQADWQAAVELGRHNGQPVLTATGRPRLMLSGATQGAGLLTADQIRVFLREVEDGGKTQPLPDRMFATGQVEINSPELLARTSSLAATFRGEETVAAEPGATDAGAGGGIASLNLDRAAGPGARKYQVQSDSMQLEIALRGKKAAPKTLACNGHVAFRELPNPELDPQAAAAQPFEVAGGQLTAERLDSEALITIRGAAPAPNATDEQLAQISARGMTVHAAEVKLDVGQNRLWIDGGGLAEMTLQKSLTGGKSATPTPVALRWAGGLVFDGSTIVVSRNVQVDSADDSLRCAEVAARLTRKVEFGKRVEQSTIDVKTVTCRGQVAIQHKSRDDVGITGQQRMDLAELTINQQTGALGGVGPGIIRSTHLAAQLSTLSGATAAPIGPLGSDAKLQFLRVDFQQSMSGNFLDRIIAFHTRVRTVYGSVDAWDQELDVNRPETLPPDTITLTSDELRVNEDPLAANHRNQGAGGPLGAGSFGPMVLTANGNVRIDGQSPQGVFYATAERAAYEQSKTLFILEGAGRVPATVSHRNPQTGQWIPIDAGKIMYNHRTGQPEFDRVRSIEITPGAGDGNIFENALGSGARRQ